MKSTPTWSGTEVEGTGIGAGDAGFPQESRERIIMLVPVVLLGTGEANRELELLENLGPRTVMMMGDNPALTKMPQQPALVDFFRLRFHGITAQHLLLSAKLALDAGMEEKVVLACLLHDISNGALLRSDHGYWREQMIAPYVDEEVAWAVRHHQALRYFADESVGYEYPDAYLRYFGSDYVVPQYIRLDAEEARRDRWDMTSRLVTLFDTYSFDEGVDVDPEQFTDIIGRHLRQPREGLGLDNSPASHMWRTMIWPNNFL
ncbi:MAG: HD domain-containing protein [Acidimicrobiales bacterium]